MTKKDYTRIATVIKKTLDGHQTHKKSVKFLVIWDFVNDLTVVFASDNPQFDQDKFLEACGL